MTAFKYASLVPCLVLLASTVAGAQQARPAPSGPFENGFMTGSAGASFSDAQAATFGIEIGERINSRVEAYAAFNYFDDLFNNQAASDLNNLSSYLSTLTATTWQLQGRDRGLAFSGGARYLLSRGPSFRPYIGGGPGVLNIRRTVTDARVGDVTDSVLVVFGAPDGFVVPDRESTFRATAEFIAGIGIASGRTYLDVGYRFRKVFRVESFTFSQFTVGVGMRF